MTELEMPIRDYLSGEFNAAVNGTAREGSGEDPFEAYVRLCSGLGARGLSYSTYAQATITSGGHARNKILSLDEVIVKNVAAGQAVAEELYDAGQLDPQDTLEATTLGLVDHWREFSYMTFWFNIIARPDIAGVNSARRVDTLRHRFGRQLERRDIDFDSFNSYGKSAEERAPYYMAAADAYKAALGSTDHKPVRRIVTLSEKGESLGVNTELYLGKKLGVRAFGLAIAELNGRQTLPAGYKNPQLTEDVESIVRYGGQVFDPRREARLIIVDQ